MWTSDELLDFEILDCGNGEKFERWANYKLIRPDPQAIWQKSSTNWSGADGIYSRSKDGGGRWSVNNLPGRWHIKYRSLTFNIKPMNFKHTGLFPEQAANWDFASDLIRDASRPIKVLNLFAYTGGATLACAHAGAQVCHVDASNGMVSWARENAISSNLKDANIRWIVDDCQKFVLREIRRGSKYDAIIMDPPSYGRGPGGELWKIEDQLFNFTQSALKLLCDTPLFIILNSYTQGLSPATMKYMLGASLKGKFKGDILCDELGLKVASTGFYLPCGNAVRFVGEK